MSETPNQSATPTIEQHEEAMVRKAAVGDPALHSQFGGDVEKFVKSWKDTRAALTRAQQELAQLRGGETPPVKQDTPADPKAEAKGGDEGEVSLTIPDKVEPSPQVDEEFPIAKLEEELVQKGDLSAETRALLKSKYKLPDALIDAHIRGFKSSLRERTDEAASLVGGAPVLKEIIKWAQDNLDADEKPEINAALSGAGWRTALLGLKARMGTPVVEPTSTPGVVPGAAGNGVAGYASQDLMMADISNPKYRSDPDFRKQVEDKIRASAFMQR